MTSAWFRGGDNLDSDDDDEETDASGEEEEEEEEEEEKEEAAPVSRRSKWLASSSKSEGQDAGHAAGAVLSKAAKEQKELTKTIEKLKNAFKIMDFSKIEEAFEQLIRLVERIQGPLHSEANKLPLPFVKCIIATQNFLASKADNAAMKQLSKPQAKACNTLKHKVKKVFKANEDQVTEFKKTWDYDDPEEGPSDDEPEVEEKNAPEPAEINTGEREWTAEAIQKKIDDILANRGKKGVDRNEQVDKLKKLLSRTSKYPQIYVALLVHLISAWFDVAPSMATHLAAGPWKSAYDTLTKLLNFLSDNPHFLLIETDVAIAETPSSSFDANDVVKVSITGNLTSFVERLDDEFVRSLQFTDPHTSEYVTRFQDEAFLIDVMERVYHYYTIHSMPKHAARIAVRLIDHLYYRRQEDHVQMLTKQRLMCEKSKKKKEKEEKEEKKDDEEDGAPAETTPKPVPKANLKRRKEYTVTEDVHDTVTRYMTLVLKHGDDKARVRALLCNMYRLALHGNFTQARDLLLMSRYADQMVTTNNPSFQIIYNRVLAQLGLAAFRKGSFKDVNLCLNDLCATQKLRELLAQGTPMQRYSQDRKPDQERQDKMKLCPFHMHINLELLEAVHLVAALLLEVPQMVANPYDNKRRMQSKAFTKLLHNYQNQVFLGPPETTRDNVFAAKRALEVGDWAKCCEYIVELKVWAFLPNADDVKEMLTLRIKEESLRCYLFKYSQYYQTMSLEALAKQFSLTENKIHSIVSKMIFNDELSGSWDQPAGAIRIHHTHPTKLQYLISRAADKSQYLVESSERILEPRNTGFGANLSSGKGYTGGSQNREWGWGNWGTGGRFSGLGNVKRVGGFGGGNRTFGGHGSQSWFGNNRSNRFGGTSSGLGGRRGAGQTRFR